MQLTQKARRMSFLLALLITSFAYGSSEEERVVLLSFPRSGRTWTLYSLHLLAPSYDVQQNPEFRNKFKLPKKSETTKTIIPSHLVVPLEEKVTDFPRENDKLILLVRNYKECFLREAKDNYHKAVNCVKNSSFFVDLFAILQCFDDFKEENKLLIYYEDLIEDPESTFSKILAFLDETQENLQPFLKNIEKHKQDCLTVYGKTYGSYSKGEDLHYHTKLAPREAIEEIDLIVKTQHFDLWNKYLSHFTEEF